MQFEFGGAGISSIGRQVSRVVDFGDITVRRSKRAGRISLRVSQLDGRATLTAPTAVTEAQIRGFLDDRRDWLRAARGRAPEAVRVEPGGVLPVLGIDRLICAAVPGERRRGAELVQDRIVVPANTDRPGVVVMALIKALARDRLAEATARYAAELGRPAGRLTLRDTRSRWGSCSTAGDLMFSWRLALMPEPVLSYVAAHEVAHLAEMNHSARFWRQVENLMPEYEVRRRWLRENGARFHAFRFAD